jgi:dipeptidase E
VRARARVRARVRGGAGVRARVRMCASSLPGGWALDDGVLLLFRGLEFARVVSSRPGAGAERVDAIVGELVRNRIEPEVLGDGPMGLLRGVDDAVAELRRMHHMRREITAR